jgi:hypothetical protein
MTGGLIQLVAKGIQDMFITSNPQITFFKTIYRRYTNFSIEPIPQYFTHNADFSKKVSCILSRCGDLIGQTVLVLTLPNIPEFSDNLTKFAWVKKIGFSIIKTIDIEIGEQLIDRHYGDWLNIWSELTDNKTNQFNNMIGNIKTLTQFTDGKEEYTLYIPLQFWFCRSYGLSIPIIGLRYSEVKINLELVDSSKCYILNPTHYILLEDDTVNFNEFEYIEQTVDGVNAVGIVSSFDTITKRLYYTKLLTNAFLSPTISGEITRDVVFSVYTSNEYEKYRITGVTSGQYVMPKINTAPVAYNSGKLRSLSVGDCFLLVNYVFLEKDERLQIAQSRNEYIIEKLIYSNEKTLSSSNVKVKLDTIQPCKLMAWIVQMTNYGNDIINYTNNYKHYDSATNTYIYFGDIYKGENPIVQETILLNGHERITLRNSNYFSMAQVIQHFNYTTNNGINIYSYSLDPKNPQPSGSCNMSEIDNIYVQMNLNATLTSSNTAKFRCYSLVHNVLVVYNGLGRLKFVD